MRFQRLCGLIVAAVIGAASACGTEQLASAIPSVDEEFTASLGGPNVVPPVTSVATGTARFAVVLDTFLVFRIDVNGLDSATAARIHVGAAGAEDTTVSISLFSGVTCRNASGLPINTASPSCRVAYSGQLSEGQFKPDTAVLKLPARFGATGRARFDSLMVLMRTGGAYVEVRTRLNPTGEIRGQIQPAP